ncbi:MAG: TonB-dependent receptor [Flavobacteriaceae bacterium]
MKFNLQLQFTMICSLLWYSTTAQTFTISGNVLDNSSGEPLIGATVLVPGTTHGVVTNNYGYFSLELAQGEYTIHVSYLGFERLQQRVTLSANQRIDFKLMPELDTLDEVVLVSDERQVDQVQSVLGGVSTLKIADVKKMPALFGEPDINRILLTQSGVNTVGEGASGFNVRGGNIDQNLILLDEAPVYNAAHLWGFFSVFNADAIKNIKLYKGGIPARFGGRGSAVLDVRQREGNNQNFEGQGGIGLLFSRLTMEGPIQKDKLSFLISGRRSYFDLLLPSSALGDDSSIFFYDLSTKLSWIINDKNRLYVSGYFGADVMRFGFDTSDDHGDERREEIDFRWRNATATVRWNHIFNDKLFMNLSGVYSQYNYGLNSKNDSGGGPANTTGSFEWKSTIDNFIVKPDFTYYQNNDVKWHFGVNATLYKFTPAKVVSEEEGVNTTNFPIERGLEIAPYVEYEHNWDKFSLLAGLRYSWFGNLGPYTVNYYDPNRIMRINTIIRRETFDRGQVTKSYSNFEPRLALNYQLSDRKAIKAGFDRNVQYIHLISNTTAALPFDIWKPAGEHIKPLDVYQATLGYAYTTANDLWQTTIEGFYKTFDQMVDYKNGADLFINDQIETQLLPAKGIAYGLEGVIQKTKGKWKGELNYTYSRSKRKTTSPFDAINIRGGAYFPSNYDRPHVLNLSVDRNLGKKWTANLFFTFQSGRPITPAIGQFSVDKGREWFLTYAERNAYRLPDNHRMDLSFNYRPNRKPQKKWKGEWAFGVYNLYEAQNAFSNFTSFDSNSKQLRTYQFSVIGSPIPFVTYNFKF